MLVRKLVLELVRILLRVLHMLELDKHNLFLGCCWVVVNLMTD
uniref:Uncharacterized protein n=1 Tax=Tetranychus urticae TaxID=32264 RepID=T1KRC4_TETUR